MADIALLASQADDAPLGYQVPGAQEIILKSITASFDGSGAGGAYVPTLQILAPNGAVLAACPVSTQVAAGASADVSWFPRGGLNAGASYTPPTAWQEWTDVATVAEGASLDLTWADPVTKLPDESGGLPFPFLDLSTETVPSPLVSGIYAVQLTLQLNGTPSAVVGALLTARADYADGGANVPRNFTLPVGPQAVMTPQFPYFVQSSFVFLIEAGDVWSVTVTNPTGTGKSLSIGWVTAVQRIT